jgi:hypothetical protein
MSMSEDQRKRLSVLSSYLRERSWIRGNPDRPMGAALITADQEYERVLAVTVAPAAPLEELLDAGFPARVMSPPTSFYAFEASYRLLTHEAQRNNWDIIDATQTRILLPHLLRTPEEYLAGMAEAYCCAWADSVFASM